MIDAHVSDQRIAVRPIASTAYDTAWVASLPSPDNQNVPRFPGALQWLTNHQWPDGSWGSSIKYEHDRIICTLAALIPMVRYGRRDNDRLQAQRGERYLWQNAHRLRIEPDELVGFELLLPTLMKMANEVGVNVPPHLDMYAAERIQKLKLIPPDLIYSSLATTAHSLEFLGHDVDPTRLLTVQSSNGSIGNSPAATAFLLHHIEDQAALAYLERCLFGSNGHGVPVLEPCETFEAMWVAYHLFLGGTPAADLWSSGYQIELMAMLDAGGVSLSPSFPVPDADDTAVALLLLHEAGHEVDSRVLKSFERDDYFVSFPFERHPSSGVNVHVLTALHRFEDYPGRAQAISKILQFLKSSHYQAGYWLDKWHISPHYATSHAIVALSELEEPYADIAQPMIETAVEWIVRTQNEDGSWGFAGMPTTEETAYALLALLHTRRSRVAMETAIETGLAYLRAQRNSPRPALWIDKCLYYPTNIVDAVIQAALSLRSS